MAKKRTQLRLTQPGDDWNDEPIDVDKICQQADAAIEAIHQLPPAVVKRHGKYVLYVRGVLGDIAERARESGSMTKPQAALVEKLINNVERLAKGQPPERD